MICRLCHGESDGPSLCRECHRDLATLYWSSGGLRRADFPRISGAGRSAGVSPARPAIGQPASSLRVSAEAAST